jgi:hypothetical protein
MRIGDPESFLTLDPGWKNSDPGCTSWIRSTGWDPDLTFHYGVEPDPDLTPNFSHDRKSGKNLNFFHSSAFYIVLSFSSAVS